MKYKRPEEQQQAINECVPVDEFMTSEIRRACRAGFQFCVARLVSLAAGEIPDTTPFASIRAIDILGKYSMGAQPKRIYIEGSEHLGIITELVAKHLTGSQYDVFANEYRATVEQMI